MVGKPMIFTILHFLQKPLWHPVAMNQARPRSRISSRIAVLMVFDGWMLWKFEEDDKVYKFTLSKNG